MVPPCIDKFIASEVALFVTVPHSPGDIARIKAAAEATRETANTLRFISADDEGHNFIGRSIDELACWLAYRYGIYIDPDRRRHHDGLDSPVCTGAFAVIDDLDALKNNWGRIVGLSPRWYEHSVDEDEDGETMPKFTNERIKMAALDRTTLPGLVTGDFKVSVYFVSLGEVADLSKIRPISLT
jgi:hypothetical protein